MKKLVVLLAVLSLASIACDAFKDNYGDDGAQLNVPVAGNPAGGNVPVGSVAVDDTVCTPVEGVTVTKVEDKDIGTVTANVLSNAKEGAKVASKAEKIGASTTKVTLLADDVEALSFTLKQTGEKEFAVCSVVYKDMKVKSGTVTIDKFNDGADKDIAKAVNSGAFKFEFAKDGEPPTAIKVMETAAGAKDDSVEGVEGTYFAEGLVSAEVKTDEEKK